jgi:hypothetical protein
MNLIINTIQSFNRVTLADLDQVKLMNRTDHKFCLHRQFLPVVLETLKNDYSILEIQGETIFPYNNTYFDTMEDQMYLNHQNGKRNRYKIRVRQYVQSEDNFLEIKFKTNKGRTIKERIERQDFHPVFEDNELNFLQNYSPYPGSELYPKITSRFNRITLVDNHFTGFKNQEKEITLENLVIIEVKRSKANKPALITQVLRANKIRQQGFSKYCIGRSLLEEKLKKNNFKPLLLKLKKEYFN